VTTILLERVDPGVVVVTLNRPESLNSLSQEMVAELHATLDAIAVDESCRCVVLTGAGRGFCSGLDVADLPGGGTTRSVQQMMAFARPIFGFITRLRSLPQPVIAAVNGPAAGTGLALSLASDIRICSESARFGVAFVRLGASGCELGISYLLPRVVGPTAAFELMLTGRVVGAEEADRIGLVLKVVPDEDLVGAAVEIAKQVATSDPFALRLTKEVMWANLEAPGFQSAIDLETRTQTLWSLDPASGKP
jgi:enoyl-CoA hydratase